MQQQTILQLIELNHRFYKQIGKYWNSSESYFWEGWYKLIPKIEQIIIALDRPIEILDLGCGNARFFNFMEQIIGPNLSKISPKNHKQSSINPINSNWFNYTGFDFDSFFVEKAKNKYADYSNFQILQTDLVLGEWTKNLTGQKFDLILIFGLLHHIPSAQLRAKLVRSASKLLNRQSWLVLTTWQFLDIPRLVKRVLPFQSHELSEILFNLQIEPQDLEEGDYILDWVKKEKAYRYAHYFQPTEIEQILQISGLDLIEAYQTDGRSGKRNKYFVCRKN